MSIDRKYLIAALAYALVGLALGIYMASSHNHGHRVTHAHILLIGFVLSFFYGIIHKLWIARPSGLLSVVQFVFHQLGAAVLLAGLFLLYGNIVPESMLGPIMGVASICVLIGMALMMTMVLKKPEQPASTRLS
jgi:peptidoglycan/LPS O-acetylase OafA/YrhL